VEFESLGARYILVVEKGEHLSKNVSR
jgi:hypothetical protein